LNWTDFRRSKPSRREDEPIPEGDPIIPEVEGQAKLTLKGGEQ